MSMLHSTQRSLLSPSTAIIPPDPPNTSGPGGISNVGLMLWLKSEVGVFQDLEGTNPGANSKEVALWQDQSGNGNHFVQDDSNRQPFYGTSSFNGVPALSFDATDDFLYNSTLVMSAGDRTVIAALLANDDGDTLQYLLDAQTGRFICAIMGDVSGSPGFYDGAWKSIGASVTLDQTLAWRFSGGTGAIYRDNVSLGSAAYTPVAVGGTVAIGAAYNGGEGTVFDGLLGEIIVYNRALELSELTTVTAYLATKYNM